MVNAGNRVTFDKVNGKNASEIYNKATGCKVPIDEVKGQYEFTMWVKNTQYNNTKGGTTKTNYKYQALLGLNEEGQDFTYFTRLVLGL